MPGTPAHRSRVRRTCDRVPGQAIGGGGHDQGTDREAGHVDRHHALGVRPYRPPRSWKVNPRLDAPGARWWSKTTIDGVSSARPSASQAAACSTVSARAQVPLPDQRRNCDHARVQGSSKTLPQSTESTDFFRKAQSGSYERIKRGLYLPPTSWRRTGTGSRLRQAIP